MSLAYASREMLPSREILSEAKDVLTSLLYTNDELSHFSKAITVHFGYSGHLGPPFSGHYNQLATISDLNVIE